MGEIEWDFNRYASEPRAIRKLLLQTKHWTSRAVLQGLLLLLFLFAVYQRGPWFN
jgi:hypothetical protein